MENSHSFTKAGIIYSGQSMEYCLKNEIQTLLFFFLNFFPASLKLQILTFVFIVFGVFIVVDLVFILR